MGLRWRERLEQHGQLEQSGRLEQLEHVFQQRMERAFQLLLGRVVEHELVQRLSFRLGKVLKQKKIIQFMKSFVIENLKMQLND